MELSIDLYKITKTFPQSEQFGLTNQLRRAGVSIASNISEGAGRGTSGDFKRFLRYAYGSLSEVDTQLEIAHRLKFVEDLEYSKIKSDVDMVQKKLFNLINSIKTVSTAN